MKKLFVASLKILFRDRQSLFWALAFPLIFTVIFSLFTSGRGNGGTIAIIVDETSPASVAVVDGLKSIEAFKISERDNFDEARSEVESGKITMAIHISAPSAPSAPPAESAPGGPGPIVVTTVFDQNDRQVAPLAMSAVRQLVDGLNLQMAGVTNPPVAVNSEGVAARSVTAYDFYLPGFVALGIENFAIVSVAASITQYREQKILKRILATPIAPAKFLGAQVLARVVISIVQVGVILGVGLAMGAHVYGSIALIFTLGAIGNLIFLNIGFAIAGRAKTVDSASGAASAIALPMMFLAGVFYPISMLPAGLQPVVKLLPLTPLVEGMRKVALEGASIFDIKGPVLLIIAWVIVSFVIALTLFHFDRA